MCPLALLPPIKSIGARHFSFLEKANLSTAHTERLGARAIDLLHVASALTLESELFLTTDIRQAHLAKGEGLKVVSIE